MAVIRTRFLFWLVKAYIKKWGKTIIISFCIGLAIFFLLLKFYPFVYRLIPLEKKVTIGMIGAFTVDSIPAEITQQISSGLTKVEADGTIKPDLASSWEIRDDGKTYVFNLKKNLRFSDGTPFVSQNINYDYAGVVVEKPTPHAIVFKLKDAYSPFLVTVSKPIFYKGYIGIGEYKINNIELNGTFIKSLQLVSTKNRFKTQTYIFYPGNEALKVAFALGEVTQAKGLSDTKIHNVNLESFPNLTKNAVTNYRQLVTLFFNTTDPLLSDKKLRDGLSYAIPDKFDQGLRVYFPYSPQSKYYNVDVEEHKQDFPHAELLINSSKESSSTSAIPKLQLKTQTKYRASAEAIVAAWKKVGIETDIEEVDTVPDDFQMFLGDFNVPRDPDQYTLWHSAQPNNITKFKSLRIDKLLEDGRKIADSDERLRIYYDFQKYLIDEAPAVFLYFPHEYEFIRK